jgi:1-acyl-sn-glycerol-3-phosphate acyltransferase
MGRVRLGAIIAILAMLTLVLMPLQSAAIRRNWLVAAWLPHLWQRIAAKLLGVRVRVVGTPATPPLLLAANHVSWIDIVVLSTVLPLSFIAKAEVAGWPAVGTLARLQRTVFIDRKRRTKAVHDGAAIGHRVGRGDVMVLFAEGTTGDGVRILPFKSALFGAAAAVAPDSGPITVQPVAVAYSSIHGIPLGHEDRPLVAWYGDMDLAPHLVRLASLGAIDVTVAFGEPMRLDADTDRKALAAACHAAVRRMIREARRDLPPPSSAGHRKPLFPGRRKGVKPAVANRPVGAVAKGRERIGIGP